LLVTVSAVLGHASTCVGNCGTDTANGDVTNPPGFSSYTAQRLAAPISTFWSSSNNFGLGTNDWSPPRDPHPGK